MKKSDLRSTRGPRPPAAPPPATGRRTRRTVHEALNPHFGFYYTVDKTLYQGKTRYQRIELVRTPEFGTTLLLDGITQVVEKNEYQYHESMVHPAMCSHPAPRSVLIIGGGDGGILREVLKYPVVKRVDVAELDEEVILFSRKYLACMHKNSFDDPRVKVHITDGRKFVEANPGRFDIVIMDMTDPFGPAKALYTRQFFAAVKRSLRSPAGIFAMHTESPISRPHIFNRITKTLQSVFENVTPLYLYIQMYAVLWSIGLASPSLNLAHVAPALVDRRLKRYGIRGLKLVNGETFAAMQIGYPYITEILRQPGAVITDRSPELKLF
jgi:spermidine synthase